MKNWATPELRGLREQARAKIRGGRDLTVDGRRGLGEVAITGKLCLTMFAA